MGAARRRDAGLGPGRGGLLLSEDPRARAAWLERGSNREEWERLACALDLAEGFVFFCVQTGDRLADRHLEALLRGVAESNDLAFAQFELGPDTTVAALLRWLRTISAPALLWVHRLDADVELGELFSLLNQKRDVIAELADSPLVLAMHALDWAEFRRRAPDFWSIHQIVCRFSPGREIQPRRFVHHEPVVRSVQASPSGWRLAPDALARLPGRPLFGREAEINALISALARPGAKILIHGPAGVGKTALLRQVVPHVRARFPDGIWWVPFDAGRKDPSARAQEVLTRLANELLPSDEPSADPGQRFRTATATMEALFVFEDVDAPEIAARLVPGERSSVIVTSRLRQQQPALFDHVLSLAGLGVEAGAAMLHQRTALDDEVGRRLASAAAGNPSLLSLASAILTDSPDAEAEVMALLSDDPGRDLILDAALARVLERRSSAARGLWPKLALFCGGFGPRDAEALGECEFDECRALLRELADVGLLEPSKAADEYQFFSVLRGSAMRLLDERGDADATWLHYARWSLCERGVTTADADLRSAVEWLGSRYRRDDGPRERIEGIVEDAVELWRLSEAGEAVIALARDVAEQNHDRALLLRVYEWFARAALLRGELDAAERWYRQQYEVAEEMRDREARGVALIGLGDVARDRGELDAAFGHYRAGLHSTLSPPQQLELLGRLGETALRLGDGEAAEAFLRDALTRAGDDLDKQASVLHALASALLKQGKLDESEAYARLAGSFAQKNMDLPEAARDHQLLGAILEQRGNLEESAAYYQISLDYYQHIGDLVNTANMYHKLGNLAMMNGDLESAEDRYQMSLAIASDLSDLQQMMKSLIRLGDLHHDRGNPESAQSTYQRALALSEQLHDEQSRAYLLARLARARDE